jgi:hypothetical protein
MVVCLFLRRRGGARPAAGGLVICGRNQKKCFRGVRGPLPPHFDTIFNRRKGGGDLSPPKYLVQRNLIANAPENAGKRRKTPENAGKRRKTPENAGKRRKTPENAGKRKTQQMIDKSPQHKKTKKI